MPKPLSPKALLSVFILVCASLALYLVFARQSEEVITTQLEPSPFANQIRAVIATGNLQAAGNVPLYANATGIVTKLYAYDGSTVVKGQKIAEIQSTATQQQSLLAQASYQDALANLQSTRALKQTLQSQLESARKAVIDAANAENILFDRLNTSKKNPATGKDYTQEEIDSIRSATISARQAFVAAEQRYLDADTNINSAQTTFSLAQLGLDSTKDATLKAHADGTLLNFKIQEGSLVQVGSPDITPEVQPLGYITNLSLYHIKVNVNETRISYVQPGQSATITFDSQKEVQYKGLVRSVDTIGTLTQGLVTYAVLVSPTEVFPDSVKPGMTAEVEIIVSP